MRLSLTLLVALVLTPDARAEVRRFRFPERGAPYVAVEILKDNLVHYEFAARTDGADPLKGIATSPMVGKRDFPGPSAFSQPAANVLETPELRVTVQGLCLHAVDLKRARDVARVCAHDLGKDMKRVEVDPKGARNVYGVGNFFRVSESADGDWSNSEWRAVGYGNFRGDFWGASPSQSQFPIAYGLGRGFENFALFVDSVYGMSWKFEDARWTASSYGDQVRGYLISGADMKALRRTYMEIVGRPQIAPRSTFGLWVSRFGYESWGELYDDLNSLRSHGFPVDGFGMDVQWFGGDFGGSDRMGGLTFDDSRAWKHGDGSKRPFENSKSVVKELREKHGVSLMLIEESYVDQRLKDGTWKKVLDQYGGPAATCFFARTGDKGCDPVILSNWENGKRVPMWWGIGSMLDWTNDAAGLWWHKEKRHKLALQGLNAHWTDLSEPEGGLFDPGAFYHGVVPGKNRHGDIHNIYALKWLESIDRGYREPGLQRELASALDLPAGPRHFAMSRGGAPGLQRYGAGMWSGDICRNMQSFRGHLNTQMHMALAGVDYYNSDVGGFTNALNGAGMHDPGYDVNELYTQWFASSALGELPLRPHGWAKWADKQSFAPDKKGHADSNRANLIQRYEMHPYVYSLAHIAHWVGDPIFPPLVYWFQDDPNLRQNGHTKMIGPSLVYSVVAGYGQTETRAYLPAGDWYEYHTNEVFPSRGEETPELPAYRDRMGKRGLFTLPVFARAGAIVPKMIVDGDTLNVSGKRREGAKRDDLVVRVFQGPKPTSFPLFEDDGESLAYESGAFRRTTISHEPVEGGVKVTIAAPEGKQYAGSPDRRAVRVELVVKDAEGTDVTVDDARLERCGSRAEYDRAGGSCWTSGGPNLVLAKVAPDDVRRPKTFVLSIAPVKPRASAHFVCDNGVTREGQAIFVYGSDPKLGSWDPKRAVRLEATRYPRWTGVVSGLEPGVKIEWKCLRMAETGPAGGVDVQAGLNSSIRTPASGYAGTSRGRLP